MSGMDGRSAQEARPRAARARSALGLGGRARQEVLQGHDAAAGPRGGADPLAGRAAARRAHRRRRSRSAGARSATCSRKRRRAARSILLNSHLLSEIERTCDRVAVLRSGRIVAEGRIDDLTASGSRYRLVATGVDDRLIAALRETGASVDRVNGHFDLTARDLDHVNAVVDRLRAGRRAAPGALAREVEPRGRLRRTSSRRGRRADEGDRVVRAFAASVQEVFREAAARWTLIAYFALSSLFILIFAAGRQPRHRRRRAGRREALRAVGRDRRPVGTRQARARVRVRLLGFVLYLVGTFLALFATAHLVPRLQEKGTIDLYLSRPVGRVPLLLSRYAGGLLLAAANLVYLIGSMWLIVVWKTHVLHPRFLLSGARHPLHDRDAARVRVPRSAS